jgi:signal transduction histidine kinase
VATRVQLDETIERLLSNAYEIRINDLDKSIELSQHAADLSKNVHPTWYARALNQLGLFNMIRGNFKEALDLSNEALTIFEPNQDRKGIADAKYTIANVYYKTDNFHTGLQYLLDCLTSYRHLGDHHNEARVLKSMGTIYEYFGDYNNAETSYQKCIEAASVINDINQVSNAYNPLSGIYLKRGLHDLALSTIQESIAIKNRTGDIRGLAFALYGRGKVYLKLKEYGKAFDDLTQALHIHKEMGDQPGEGLALNKLGLTCLGIKNYEEAEKYFKQASRLAERLNVQFILFKANYNLYLLAHQRGDIPEALERLQKYVTQKEGVINTHTYNVIKSYESIKKIESLENEAKAQRDKAAIIEKKNAELDSFFYRISHDLKGPIASLLGLYNLVMLEIKDKTALNYFDMYQSQLVRINNIVMDLINLTRMNHDGINRSKINFRILIDDCILSYHYLENFGQIRFVKEIDSTIDFTSEWAIVNTILQNLIENAIKYQRKDGEPYVGIFVSQSNNHVEIRVEDNGQGIGTDHQSKIFDMFFRANEHAQGTGLGLYILKRAVERLGGEVTLQSEINKGSSFMVLLPFEGVRPLTVVSGIKKI